MIRRRYIDGMDVLSVLLFSILANVLLDVHIDFTTQVDWVALVRTLSLALGSILLYTTTVRYKRLAEHAVVEYASETSAAAKAEYSIDARYEEFLKPENRRLSWRLVATGVCVAAFILIPPIGSLMEV